MFKVFVATSPINAFTTFEPGQHYIVAANAPFDMVNPAPAPAPTATPVATEKPILINPTATPRPTSTPVPTATPNPTPEPTTPVIPFENTLTGPYEEDALKQYPLLDTKMLYSLKIEPDLILTTKI